MSRPLPLALKQLKEMLLSLPAAATLAPYPRIRNFTTDILAEGRRKNIINLVFETDISTLRRHISGQKSSNREHISLTSGIARAFARTIGEDKSIHAYRRWKHQLVVFDDVDLAMMIERDVGDVKVPLHYIVRAAHQKTAAEIHHELQSAKTNPLGEDGPLSAMEKHFFSLPSLLRKFVWIFIRNNPWLFKKLVGTAAITSMGMHTQGSAVVIPITPMTLTLSIGSIVKRLVMENHTPVEREFIQMNLGADHDIIDGVPLMCFADRFKKHLEAGIEGELA